MVYEYIIGARRLPEGKGAKFECEFNGTWFPHSVWSTCFSDAYLLRARFRRLGVVSAIGEATLGVAHPMAVGQVALVLPDTFNAGQRVRYTVEVIDP